MQKYTLHIGTVGKITLIFNILMAFIYLWWWFLTYPLGHPILFLLLLIGEIYHVIMALTFWFTIWPHRHREARLDPDFQPLVDIYITVAGEPVDIVARTIQAAKNISYTPKKIYVLNDGFVAKKDNWQQIEATAKQLGVGCITRKTPGGAKAGNINHALKLTSGEIIVIFDADMAAYPEFLTRTIPFFCDSKVGFVQSPQFYKNKDLNTITQAAWQQQEFFFGPIMVGKSNYNSAFICGTNVAIRRSALLGVGGMKEDNIAEDFLTSIEVHQQSWRSHYVPEILAEGLAPEDLLSYYKQQLRWARGSLEVLFASNPFFKPGLTLSQKIQYLSSALYYFNGPFVVIDAIMPLILFYFDIPPVQTDTSSFALFFAPFMALTIYTLYQSSKSFLSFSAISFGQSSFYLQLQALFSILVGRQIAFAVTPKKAQSGNFLFLAYPHIAYIMVGLIGIGIAAYRHGITASITANIAWFMFNALLFLPFINAAWQRSTDEQSA